VRGSGCNGAGANIFSSRKIERKSTLIIPLPLLVSTFSLSKINKKAKATKGYAMGVDGENRKE
jgi:hypothetical protein